jgi:hypothetical protein
MRWAGPETVRLTAFFRVWDAREGTPVSAGVALRSVDVLALGVGGLVLQELRPAGDTLAERGALLALDVLLALGLARCARTLGSALGELRHRGHNGREYFDSEALAAFDRDWQAGGWHSSGIKRDVGHGSEGPPPPSGLWRLAREAGIKVGARGRRTSPPPKAGTRSPAGYEHSDARLAPPIDLARRA